MEHVFETKTNNLNYSIVKSILWLLFLSLGVQIIVGFAVGVVMSANDNSQHDVNVELESPVVIATLSVLSALIIGVVLKRTTKLANQQQLIQFLGFKKIDQPVLIKVLLIGTVYYATISLLLYLFDVPTPDFMLEIKAGTTSLFDLILMVIAICLIAPVVEEVIFRGVGYGRLKNSSAGTTGAIILPSLLFTIIHLQYQIIDMLTILPLALLLGYIRHKTNNIWYCIILHFQVNALSTLLLFVLPN